MQTMSARLLQLVCLLLVLTLQLAAGQVDPNQCSANQLGTDRNPTGSSSNIVREEFLYLNTRDPSDCWGTITQINFCYYEPAISLRSSNSIYKINFGVYRRSSESDGTIVYNLVSDVFTVERTQSQIDNELDYDDGEYDNSDICKNFDLDQPFTVNPGDILGACVYDPPSGNQHQLDMVRSTTRNGYNLLRAGTTGCTSTSLPQTVSALTEIDELALHLYADIEPLPPTEAPTTEAPTTQAATTPAPTTEVPTTQAATTPAATTEAPTTQAATTPAPTTEVPTTQAATTPAPTTEAPTTQAATTPAPTTEAPTTQAATTSAPTTQAATTSAPATEAPTTQTTTEGLTTETSTTQVTTTEGFTIIPPPVTQIPMTDAPTTTNPQTTEDATTSSTGEIDNMAQGGSNNIVTIIVPVVIVLLLVGAVFGFMMLIVMKRYRKKGRRDFNIQSSRNQRGIDNVLYSKHARSAEQDTVVFSPIADYDEVKQRSDFHTDEVKQCSDLHTDEDYDFIDEDKYEYPETDIELDYGNVYAEVGPYNEDTSGNYDSPIDAQGGVRFSELLEKNKEADLYDHISPYQVPATKERQLYGQLKSWGTRSIPLHEIHVSRDVAPSQFRSVEQGVWRKNGRKPVNVELKCLVETSEDDRVKFLQEAAIMAQFGHSNVILLHGVVIQGSPMMIVAETATKGNLRDYLNSLRPKPGDLVSSNVPMRLLKCAQQVALGMQYLSAKGFVHRDLAARNVLMTSNNICKIAEFGMSRNLADESYYVSQGGRIPVKWTAPETIHYKKYSTASDVWAYGCLLYEIWSLGRKPFEGIQNIDVIQLVDSGKRLPPPPGCPRLIYELMTICWHPQTMVRPGFRDIVLTLVGSEEMVLNIPEEDSSTKRLAGVLGAPLEAGENMYSQLQNRYIDYLHKAGMETDTDYFDVL